MSEPFTAGIVHGLLADRVLRGRQHRPALGGKKLEALVEELNNRVGYAEYRAGLEGETKAIALMRQAIPLWIDVWPAIREEYEWRVAAAKNSERLGLLSDVALAQAELEALDALTAAAKAVAGLGLPRPPHEENHGLPLERWPGPIVTDLMEMFKRATGDGPDEAGYRFIAAVIPKIIPGEEPSFDAVKIAYLREKSRDKL